MILLCLLQHKSILSPKVDPASPGFTPAGNRALKSAATASTDSSGLFPPPFPTPPGKKPHTL